MANAIGASDSKPKDLNAVVMHEIRNVHCAMLLALQILADCDNLEEARKTARSVLPAAEHMQNIINSGLDLASLQSGKCVLTQTNIRELISWASAMVSGRLQEKNLTLKTHVSDKLPQSFETDLTKTRQVLLNLLNNAIKFTPENGNISLVARLHNGNMHFAVIDSGPGMSEQTTDTLFKPFAQAQGTTQHGTGLGLYISRLIVEGLGGQIGVVSRVGMGSNFHFELPIGESAQAEAAPISTSDEVLSESTGKRVLIVEDSEAVAQLLQIVVRQHGAECTLKDNGADGLDEALKHRYNLILVDSTLPRLSGLEVVRQIRQYEQAHGGHAEIVGMSGYSQETEFNDAGASAFVMKPLGPTRVLELLNQAPLLSAAA
jgi:CheY-like chemotaxis protein